jgi:hypothetical protein
MGSSFAAYISYCMCHSQPIIVVVWNFGLAKEHSLGQKFKKHFM